MAGVGAGIENPLSEFHSDRVICKHFNMSYLDIRDNLSMTEYYCLLAEALDAEELEPYSSMVNMATAFHDPKRLRNYKWQSPDKAGTLPLYYGDSADVAARTVVGAALKGGATKPKKAKIEHLLEYAKRSGKTVVYQMEDGRFKDEEGNIIVKKVQGVIAIPWIPEEENTH